MKFEDVSSTQNPSLGKTKSRSMKASKTQRKFHSLRQDSLLTAFTMNQCQIIPLSSLCTDSSPSLPKSTLINTNILPISIINPSISTGMIPSPTLPSSTILPIHPSFKAFASPKVTTTLIPLNVCPTERSESVQTSSISTISRVDKKCITSSEQRVTTHQIGDWIIRESSEPFRQKENQVFSSETSTNQKDSSNCYRKFPSNVKQWSIDDVCVFFENVLGKDTFTPIIREHLIDGFALLLLQDEHLEKIFKMQLGPRLKLLNRIQKLKMDLSN